MLPSDFIFLNSKFFVVFVRSNILCCLLLRQLQIYNAFRKEYVVEEFSSQEEIWLDITNNIQVRILILSREVGYVL